MRTAIQIICARRLLVARAAPAKPSNDFKDLPAKLRKRCKAEKHLHADLNSSQAVYRRRPLPTVILPSRGRGLTWKALASKQTG